jgi:alpha-galactosidase
MDMMEIGNGGLTIQEQRTHFASWIFMKSPIILGTDLENLSTEQVQIITNRELLEYHQDTKVAEPAMPFKGDDPRRGSVFWDTWFTSLMIFPGYLTKILDLAHLASYANLWVMPPEYFSGRSSKGIHVFMINTWAFRTTKQFTLSTIPGVSPTKEYKFHDMWTGNDLERTYSGRSRFSVTIGPHDTVAYLLVPV